MTSPTPQDLTQSHPRIEAEDKRFDANIAPDAEVRCIADGLKFTEGPVWLVDRACLLLSDIPADKLYRWSEKEGLSVWRESSHHANGNTLDAQGRLVTCEHGSRTVTRTGKDGKVETIAATFGGKRLNSPNDAVVKRDGSVWFTDPPYGIKPEQIEQAGNYVFRLDPGAAEPAMVCADFARPNGLCFSPDESLLYIADSDRSTHHIRRFRVREDNTLEGGEVFATVIPDVPDGMRTDRQGRLFTSAGDGVQVFDPDGALLGKIILPEPASNCCFGGVDGKTLFITARGRVWAVGVR